MNEQLLCAYYLYLDDRARSGVIDHALDNAILEGKTVEEAIVGILRAAGRLPDGWDGDASPDELVEERRRKAV
jgi:hypothetical protein